MKKQNKKAMKALAQQSVMQRHGLPACETQALTLSVQTMPCKAQMQRLLSLAHSQLYCGCCEFSIAKESNDIVTDPYCLTWPLNCWNSFVYGRSDTRTAVQNENRTKSLASGSGLDPSINPSIWNIWPCMSSASLLFLGLYTVILLQPFQLVEC